jgi:hypothetical protein
MTASTKSMTLFFWNILVLPSGEEIFVGLRERPETIPPFLPADDSDELLPFILHNSDAIESFDKETGIGHTKTAVRYVLIGQPNDPTGIIQFSVSQLMREQQAQWKYPFAEI